jgi:hypothetical protein
MRVVIPTPMLMPSGSLTTVLNRKPGWEGTVGLNVPSPCKPADMPVQQFDLQTARALGIEVPPGLLAIADEVIE